MEQKLFTRNFTLLVLGQLSSLLGNITLKFALAMYILEVTGSAAVFGGLLAIATVPTIVLSPFGGILADRANRRTIMVALDLLSGFTMLLAAVLFSQQNAIFTLGVILVVLSILGAFESPTVQACIPQMQRGDNIIRANAVVNQVTALAALLAPILGSVLYTAFGLRPIMMVSVGSFFLTAFLECFIKMEYKRVKSTQNAVQMIKSDFCISMRFIVKEQPGVLQVLLLAAMVNFLLTGAVSIGLPFLIRNVLGLGAEHYGMAESALALAVIAGSVSVSFLVKRVKTQNLYRLLTVLGISFLPVGAIFLLPAAGAMPSYFVITASLFVMQFVACVFSIFALSAIQQKTPNELIGKIMAYVVTITLCAQPLGQLVYGALFDSFSSAIYLVLIPTGIFALAIGLASQKTFYTLGRQGATPKEVAAEKEG